MRNITASSFKLLFAILDCVPRQSSCTSIDIQSNGDAWSGQSSSHQDVSKRHKVIFKPWPRADFNNTFRLITPLPAIKVLFWPPLNGTKLLWHASKCKASYFETLSKGFKALGLCELRGSSRIMIVFWRQISQISVIILSLKERLKTINCPWLADWWYPPISCHQSLTYEHFLPITVLVSGW